ncbi:rna-processing protein [Diplodia corticola]|uniref:Rna-processing protein n=1 Tax=Diplodia corticola TaxID=236234 RepID=A0A1J9R7A8_9PEZI|nr:rna-processing protein [Diplodia corticola]OJD36090.1 rna-processing protein [Diplodia corticola]
MAAPPAKKALRPGKPVFKLDLPYTQPQWPQISTADHDIILEMLVNLLVPIGQHRSAHGTPSKGKRSRKRKRHGALSEAATSAPPPPPPPDLIRHITVGINSTTRHLEQLAQAAGGAQSDQMDPSKQSHAVAPGETNAPPHPAKSLRHLSLIITLQPPSSITTSHLPLLTQTASHGLASSETALLVPLKPVSESKLATALGLPRVGVIGIMDDAPGVEPLIKYARERVPTTDVPWLREALGGHYLPVNVLTEQPGTKSGSRK